MYGFATMERVVARVRAILERVESRLKGTRSRIRSTQREKIRRYVYGTSNGPKRQITPARSNTRGNAALYIANSAPIEKHIGKH